jgi:hypothetical protein
MGLSGRGAQNLGLRRLMAERRMEGPVMPAQPSDPPAVTTEAIRAFLTGDQAWLRAHLAIDPWDNSPCCAFAEPDAVRTEGDHRALAYRQRLIAEIERLGAFRFDDLKAEDNATAAAAWTALAVVAEQGGVDASTWDAIAARAGWYRVDEEAHPNG